MTVVPAATKRPCLNCGRLRFGTIIVDDWYCFPCVHSIAKACMEFTDSMDTHTREQFWGDDYDARRDLQRTQVRRVAAGKP